MTSPLVFFSFVTLEDAGPAEHRAYNEWHQLDHRPENLALPGVLWGDRWARPADYRAAGVASDEHAATDYVAMYWFKDPVERALKEWSDLGSDSFQWGRGPLIPGVRRKLLSFFRPVKGYAAPSALVSPDVLPYRPNRGLHLTLSRHAAPHSAATHEHYAWQDRSLIPGLLDLDGVAGAWTFSFAHHQSHPSLPLATETPDAPESLRIRLVYLDADPLPTTAAIDARTTELAGSLGADAAASEEVLLSTPLRTIIPWQDW
ncbi:hypothetical protein F9L07_24850 [Pimelobacter simplex]|uniref:Uncharacterized protein n=1 Tax=Nocardioides simplex TaxID=2045 RepID=A0A7J5DSJ4_NOCSI|nr:hypothetical protein [Pimelobacter simplex]KAB2807910.1 hypothetical protein F9L07_24850 [Pimelobacter simplex]